MFIAGGTIGTAREASAATTTKAYYVPTKVTMKYKDYDENGNAVSTESYGYTYTYYDGARAGLLKSVKESDNYRTDFSRNGSGLVTTVKKYNSSGSLYDTIKTTINKGKVKRLRFYSDGADEGDFHTAYIGRIVRAYIIRED